MVQDEVGMDSKIVNDGVPADKEIEEIKEALEESIGDRLRAADIIAKIGSRGPDSQ